MVPVHNKGDKQILKNYRPISLLPIAGKIYERLVYGRTYEFFIENNLMSKNQVLDQVILALIKLSLSLMKFINPLIIIFESELYF